MSFYLLDEKIPSNLSSMSLGMELAKWHWLHGAALFLLSVVCVVIDALTINQMISIDIIPQSLHLWMWVFYYMLGGWFAEHKIRIKQVKMKTWIKCSIALVAIGVVCIWQVLVRKFCGSISTYGAFPVIVAVCVIMFLAIISKMTLNSFGKELSQCVMGIYIIHPFVLSIVKYYVPGFLTGGAILNLLFWILTSLISLIGTIVIRRIPILNRLVKI